MPSTHTTVGPCKACEDFAKWMDEASEDIDGWGAYAGEYFQEKWDYQGDIEKYRQRAASIRSSCRHRDEGVRVPREPTEEMVDAPRQIILYSETPGRTLKGLREHLLSAGIPLGVLPDWALTEDGHLTKAAIAALVWHIMLAAAPKTSDEGAGRAELVKELLAPFERYDSIQLDKCRALMERAARALEGK